MKTRMLALLASCLFCLGAQAQTNTVPPNLWDYLTTGSNYFGGGYGTINYKLDTVGGGVFVGYRATEFLAPIVRMDYWSGKLYTMSLDVELQVPRSLLGKVPVIPFAIAGVETPISGDASTDACVGAGAAFRLDFIGNAWFWQHLDIVADYEWHAGLPVDQQHQIRLGILLKL